MVITNAAFPVPCVSRNVVAKVAKAESCFRLSLIEICMGNHGRNRSPQYNFSRRNTVSHVGQAGIPLYPY